MTADLFDKQSSTETDEAEKKRLKAVAKFNRVMHDHHFVMSSNRWEPSPNKLHCPYGMMIECKQRAEGVKCL